MNDGGSADRPWHVLPTLVVAQLAATSLWFAGNAVLGALQAEGRIGEGSLGLVTSSVQLGFIAGTLLFAVLNVADRLPPRLVFLVSAVVGAAANAAIVGVEGLTSIVTLRFVVGVSLAGIYPVGMKLAASWFARGLGGALGLLVGALVLGTALPHLLNAGGEALPWRGVLLGVSAAATAGGVLLFVLVPSGPHLPARSPFDPRAVLRVFRDRTFRAAAFGYFGHMWELYAFWAFVPTLVAALAVRGGVPLDVPLWSFVVIAAGAVGCIGGGLAARRAGSARVAAALLAVSGALCVGSPLLFELPVAAALVALVVWGIAVVGDSPQFSTLNAVSAPRELVGTALTIVTSLGFLITIPSIQLLGYLVDTAGVDRAFLVLAPGPVLGLVAVRRLVRTQREDPPRVA